METRPETTDPAKESTTPQGCGISFFRSPDAAIPICYTIGGNSAPERSCTQQRDAVRPS